MFTRSVPYVGHSLTGTAVVVAAGKTKAMLVFPSSAPLSVVQLVHRCWDMDPDNRPSFQQMYPAQQLLLDYKERYDDIAVIWAACNK